MYIVNKTVNGHLKIQKTISQPMLKNTNLFTGLTLAKYFSTLEETFHISVWPSNIKALLG